MPAPPPPPPPADFPKSEKLQNTIHKVTPQDVDKIIERQLLFDETLKEVFYKTNYYLTPQLQEGPKCGLVALSIASSISKNVGVDYILEKARCKNFTKQGEIFDAKYLAVIAEECCNFTATIIEGGLHKHINCIINNLLNKNLILIPYDADHNHSPCLKQGFKAHWAVITGFVIFTTNETSEAVGTEECNFVSINSDNHPLCDCLTTSNTHLNKSYSEGRVVVGKKIQNHNNNKSIIKGKVFLIGLQGKSKYLGFWEVDDVAKSNDNLLYFSPDRDADDYVVPEGGPAFGLKGKAVVLKSNNEQLM